MHTLSLHDALPISLVAEYWERAVAADGGVDPFRIRNAEVGSDQYAPVDTAVVQALLDATLSVMLGQGVAPGDPWKSVRTDVAADPMFKAFADLEVRRLAEQDRAAVLEDLHAVSERELRLAVPRGLHAWAVPIRYHADGSPFKLRPEVPGQSPTDRWT